MPNSDSTGYNEADRQFHEKDQQILQSMRAGLDASRAAAQALGDIYAVNVFPNMNVWWDTYPNHIGHKQSPGCGRCHSRGMRTEEREQVSSDCDTCHIVLAEEEENPDIIAILNPE